MDLHRTKSVQFINVQTKTLNVEYNIWILIQNVEQTVP